jgi:hypothetical protein
MNTYRHTQRGTLIIVVMLIMSAFFIALGTFVLRPLLAVVPVLLLCGWLFHSLTIEIANGELCWRFGPGLIHRRVSLAEIANAQQAQTNFIEGWGIRLGRFGCLYNVSGFDAVAFTLKSGKRFALGTDEPVKLLASIASP